MQRCQLLFVIVAASSIISLSQNLNRKWPEWFIEPLKYPQFYVGYSYNGIETIIDAVNNINLFSQCSVQGDVEFFINHQYLNVERLSNYFYYFYKDSTTKKGLYRIDSFIISSLTNDHIDLFSSDSLTSKNFSKKFISAIILPYWINKSYWTDHQYHYGVGFYTTIGNDIDAWKTAEERAIFSILRSVWSDISQIKLLFEESNKNSYLETIIKYKLNYIIKNIQIIGRYPDSTNKLYYVLVRIPINDLTVLISSND